MHSMYWCVHHNIYISEGIECILMRRKLIQHGASSLTVTIPQQWASKLKLKKGDEVEVSELDERLVISTKPVEREAKKVELTFETIDDWTKRSLEIPYIEGVDEIIITCKQPSLVPKIQEQMNRLLGYEIINHTGDKIIIKNITTGIDAELDVLARRILRMLVVTIHEAREDIEAGKFEKVQELINIEKISAKLIYFFVRSVNRSGYKNQKKTYAIFAIIWAIEQVFDNYRDLAKYMINNNIKLSKQDLKILTLVDEYVKQYYQIAYNFDFATFNKFYKSKPEIEEKLLTLLSQRSSDPTVLLYLYAILEKVYHMGVFFSPASNNFL